MASVMQKWLPVIDAGRCTGCELCVDVCGPDCLAIVDEISVLIEPDVCGSEEHCIEPCLDDAIHMRWVDCEGDESVGVWRRAPVA